MESNGFHEYKRLYEERFTNLDDAIKEVDRKLEDLHNTVLVQQTSMGLARWIAVTIVSLFTSGMVTGFAWFLGRH